ncbi:MFS transporter [Amycolatopsis sp. NPDC050768]|uniref:MFS transporter n=1 Tax=Amycolatopsis sp. NPDC050768 TaxID=3154839 RepID=UPI0033F46323
MYGALFLIPLYFEQERGLGAFAAGMILALQGVGSLLTRWVGGVIDRVGARVIAVVGIAGCAAATVPFVVAGPSTSFVVLGVALVVRGGALSAANIAVTSAAFTRLPREDVPSGRRWCGWCSSSAGRRARRCSRRSRPRVRSTWRSW